MFFLPIQASRRLISIKKKNKMFISYESAPESTIPLRDAFGIRWGSVSRTVSRLNPLLYKFLSRTRFKSCPTEENPLRLQSYMISNLSPNLIANC